MTRATDDEDKDLENADDPVQSLALLDLLFIASPTPLAQGGDWEKRELGCGRGRGRNIVHDAGSRMQNDEGRKERIESG